MAMNPHLAGSNSVANLANAANASRLGGLGGLGGFGSGFMNFINSPGFSNIMDLGSLALNTYGLNKSLGFAEDQLGILKDQENRASTAQNFQTGNSLAMALQMTTPGTPEHERIKQAIAQGTFQV